MARFLVITNLYPPHHYGGYELLSRDVVNRWRSRGHTVEVLTSTHRVRQPGGPEEPGVHRELRFYWEDHELLRPPVRTRLAWERSNHAALERVLAELRPDVVSVWNFGAMGYPLLAQVAGAGIPMVLVIGDNWLVWGPEYDRWTSMFAGRGRARELAGRGITALTGIATTYPDLGRDAVALYASSWLQDRVHESSRFHFERESVVAHGFDDTQFPIVETARREWRGRLLFVGRVDERKGVFTVLRAVADLPDARLTIAGPGDEAEIARATQLVAELGIGDRVEFTQRSRDEVRELYLDADAVLFVSEWGEPFGIVPLEAMACGAPVIATATGGSADFLEDGVNCIVVPPGDAGAQAAAVQRLAGDAGLRDTLRSNGRNTAERYTARRTADDLEQWHVEAMSARVNQVRR